MAPILKALQIIAIVFIFNIELFCREKGQTY